MSEKRKDNARLLKKDLQSHFLGEGNQSVNQVNDSDIKTATSLFNELSAYFRENYQEAWLMRGGQDQQAYAKFWILHLLGLDRESVLQGVDEFIKSGRGNFPPTPIEFRAHCLRANGGRVESASSKKSLPILR